MRERVGCFHQADLSCPGYHLVDGTGRGGWFIVRIAVVLRSNYMSADEQVA